MTSKKKDIKALCQAFDDIVWMAIRYAHGRHTYAPSMVRDACEVRARFESFVLKPDHTIDDITFEDDKKNPFNAAVLRSDYLFDLFEKYRSDDNEE